MATREEMVAIHKWCMENPDNIIDEADNYPEIRQNACLYYMWLVTHRYAAVDHVMGKYPDYTIIHSIPGRCAHIFQCGDSVGLPCGLDPVPGRIRCAFHDNPIFRLGEFYELERAKTVNLN